MVAETVRIDEMVLRAPSLSRDGARSLGQEVARQLADLVPDQARFRAFGALELRVQIPVGTPPSQMSAVIAGRILRGIAE